MTLRLRERGRYAALLFGTWLIALTSALFVSRDQWIVPFGLTAAAGVFLAGLLGETALLVLLTIAALLQPPLGDIGPIPGVQLYEVVVPLVLFSLFLRSVAGSGNAKPAEAALPVSRGARAVHLSLAFFAAVILLNFFRTRYLLNDVISVGVTRVFYAYFVGIATFAVIYLSLRMGRVTFDTLFRVIYVLSAIVSLIGVGAVLLHIPLNFGTLEYSVYDFASGGVRVGFLETFGLAGLALAATREIRFRVPAALLFAAAIIVSGGRGTAIGTVAALVLYLLLSRRGLMLLAAAAVVLTVAFTFPVLRTNVQVQRLTRINQKEFASDGRDFIYRESAHAFVKHPLFGTGLGVPVTVPAATRQAAEFYESQLETGGHGTYAALMKNFGLSGLLPFAAALLGCLWQLGKRVRSNPAAAFFFIFLIGKAVGLVIGGRGDDPILYFALGGAVALLASGVPSGERSSAEALTPVR